jgi:hypothetical protein
MEISEAIAAAEKDPEVQAHLAKGYYLSSTFTLPETLNEIAGWTLVYFNPKEQMACSVDVSASGVKTANASAPLVEGSYSRLDAAGALASSQLLGILVGEIAKAKEFPAKVIITLRDGVWRVAVMTQSLKLIRIDLEMQSGAVKDIEKSGLVRMA